MAEGIYICLCGLNCLVVFARGILRLAPDALMLAV